MKRLKILIVSDSLKKRNAIARWIIAGCEEIALDIEGIYLKKNFQESIEKINGAEIDVVLCDKSIPQWREISKLLKKRGGSKTFLLVDEDRSGLGYDDKDVDGVFCLGSIKEKNRQVCSIIAQMVCRKSS